MYCRQSKFFKVGTFTDHEPTTVSIIAETLPITKYSQQNITLYSNNTEWNVIPVVVLIRKCTPPIIIILH